MDKLKAGLLICIAAFSASAAANASNTFPSSGNVGIGTTSPSEILQVETGAAATILLGGTSTGDTSLQLTISENSGGYSSIQSIQSSNEAWGSLNLNASGGNVGIGTTSPGQLLEVNGTAKVDTGLIIPLIYPASDSATAVQIDKANGTSNVVDIDTTNGRVGIGTTSPGQLLEVNGTAKVDTGLIIPLIYPASDSTTAIQIDKANGTSNVVDIDTTNGRVGIGTSSPTTGVSLDLGSNTNSMLLPIGTTGQRPTGVAGMLRYNSTNSIPEFYIGSWLPVPLTASSPLVINSTTGNITCPTCNTSSADVILISGDGVLISNSASTGAVTLTLGNAAAYSVWGNNTSSSATPAYTNSPELSGTITDIQSIGATSTDGVVLTDTTAATAGNQSWSPRVRWTGQGWKTNATAGSQEVDAIAEVQPVQGTANPTFNWVLSGQINNGGYAPLLTVPSGGGLNLNSGVYEINGTQLAASNLLNGVTGSGSIVLSISPSLTTPNVGAATGTSLAVTGNITTSGGEIGIGTTSPINSLDVSGGVAIGTGYAGTDTAPTNGLIVQGDVGIGTSSPSNPLSVNGIIQSLTGGFKFPDGTTQTTAASTPVGMVLLATVNASGASSVAFGSTYITSTYNKYVIEFDSVYTSDGLPIGLQVSANNGGTYQTTEYQQSNVPTGCGNSGYPYYQPCIALGSTSTSASSPLVGTIKFSTPSNNSSITAFVLEGGYVSGSGPTTTYYSGIGSYWGATGSINAIQIIDTNGGTITGNFHLYGLSGT